MITRRNFFGSVAAGFAALFTVSAFWRAPVAEERILSAGWKMTFLPYPGHLTTDPAWPYPMEGLRLEKDWDGKTVITNAGKKGIGLYDVNGERCPPGIKYHARRMIRAQRRKMLVNV